MRARVNDQPSNCIAMEYVGFCKINFIERCVYNAEHIIWGREEILIQVL